MGSGGLGGRASGEEEKGVWEEEDREGRECACVSGGLGEVEWAGVKVSARGGIYGGVGGA